MPRIRFRLDTPPALPTYAAGDVVDVPSLTAALVWYLDHGYAEIERDPPALEAAQLPAATPRTVGT